MNKILFSTILITNLASTLFGYTRINLFFGEFLVCIVPFCVSFFLLDLNSAVYGFQASKKIIKLVLHIRLVLAILLYLLIKPLHIYTDYINTIIQGMFAGYIAGYAGYFLNIFLFSKLNNYFDQKKLWLNVLIVTSVGEFCYSTIANVLFMYIKFSLGQIVYITISGFWFKLMFEIITLPLLYIFIYYIFKLNKTTDIVQHNKLWFFHKYLSTTK